MIYCINIINDQISDRFSDRFPDQVPDQISDQVSDRFSDRFSDQIRIRSGWVLNQNSDSRSDQIRPDKIRIGSGFFQN